MSTGTEVQLATPRVAEDPVFLLDFASPDAYLAAERILALAPVPVAWIPVDSAGLAGGRSPALDDGERAAIERLGAERGLQRFVWPDPYPFDPGLALRAATYAKGIGRVVAFSLAAFRQCYAAGRSLEHVDNVVIAASGCEMHPAAVIKGCELRATATALGRATALARERGVRSAPAVYVPGTGDAAEMVFHGDAQLEAAMDALTRRAA